MPSTAVPGELLLSVFAGEAVAAVGRAGVVIAGALGVCVLLEGGGGGGGGGGG